MTQQLGLYPEKTTILKYISYDIIYMWNLKRSYTNEIAYKKETDSQTL